MRRCVNFFCFQIGWDGPVVIEENLSAHVATLRLLSVGTDARLSTTVTVHTNVTTIKIPLRAYNGKLTKVSFLLVNEQKKNETKEKQGVSK